MVIVYSRPVIVVELHAENVGIGELAAVDASLKESHYVLLEKVRGNVAILVFNDVLDDFVHGSYLV